MKILPIANCVKTNPNQTQFPQRYTQYAIRDTRYKPKQTQFFYIFSKFPAGKSTYFKLLKRSVLFYTVDKSRCLALYKVPDSCIVCLKGNNKI